MLRHITTIIITALFILMPALVMAGYTVDCEGYNHVTSTRVAGVCTNGEFNGTDSETGNDVNGDCEIGGNFEATDSVTNDYVTGECEGIKPDDGDSEDNGEENGEDDLG
jgi:hypothetical protein